MNEGQFELDKPSTLFQNVFYSHALNWAIFLFCYSTVNSFERLIHISLIPLEAYPNNLINILSRKGDDFQSSPDYFESAKAMDNTCY